MTPRVFGCTSFVQDLSPRLDKLSPRSIECVFIRYFRTQKEYRCYNPSTIEYLASTDITFLSLFHISLHRFLSPYLRLFLLYCWCHRLHLLIQILCQCQQQKLQIHMHQSQFRISDTYTFFAQRFLSQNQFRLTTLRLTVLLHHQLFL